MFCQRSPFECIDLLHAPNTPKANGFGTNCDKQSPYSFGQVCKSVGQLLRVVCVDAFPLRYSKFQPAGTSTPDFSSVNSNEACHACCIFGLDATLDAEEVRRVSSLLLDRTALFVQNQQTLSTTCVFGCVDLFELYYPFLLRCPPESPHFRMEQTSRVS